jgi:hypothetical protein
VRTLPGSGDIAESLELTVAAAHRRRLELEGGDVGSHYDFVGCVHATANAWRSALVDTRAIRRISLPALTVCHWVSDLCTRQL